MTKKVMAVVAVLMFGLAVSCGGGSSSSGTTGTADCTSVSGQALVCGTVTAADLTPVVGAEVKNTTSGAGTAMPGYYKGLPDGVSKSVEKSTTTTCLTDANGSFACEAGTASGSYTFSVTMTGFSLTFASDLTLDSTTAVPAADTTATGANITAKWLVITGSWDGVQLLLSQMKGCTLTGSESVPEDMTGSAACEAVNLVVQDASLASTTFSDIANLTPYNSIFINCGTDMSAYSTVIQEYVAAGNNIYFSDLSDPGVTAAFPDKVTYGTGSTTTGTVTANADNADLQTYLGKTTVDIDFNLGSWMPIASVASGVTTFVSGDTSSLGGTVGAPITVGWKQDAKGCVFYTSYHIETGGSATADQAKVLKYLILNAESVCE